MKTLKTGLADILAVVLLIASFFAPYFASSLSINPNVLILIINCYLISYLSYLMSFMESKKILLLGLPLLVYTGFLVFLLNDFGVKLSLKLINDMSYIITNLFDVIFVSLVFFLVEIILNRILGLRITNAIAALGLVLYLLMYNTDLIPFDFYYKDILIYFAFYVMATRISPANKVNPMLYALGIILLGLEIIAYAYYRFYPVVYFSVFILTYVILKDSKNTDTTTYPRYLAFSYLYPYKVLLMLAVTYIPTSPVVHVLLAAMATFIISQGLYKIRFKILDYLLVGIH